MNMMTLIDNPKHNSLDNQPTWLELDSYASSLSVGPT